MARILTLWQPWASLVALGIKQIETRSWSTKYRGPLLIHAAKRRPDVRSEQLGGTEHPEFGNLRIRDHWNEADPFFRLANGRGFECDLPLGAVVAVADLVDCLPIIAEPTRWPTDGQPFVAPDTTEGCHHARSWSYTKFEKPIGAAVGGWASTEGLDLLEYGDYTSGRWAWMLDNIRPLPEPIPWKGGQGLRKAPPELIEQCMALTVEVT